MGFLDTCLEYIWGYNFDVNSNILDFQRMESEAQPTSTSGFAFSKFSLFIHSLAPRNPPPPPPPCVRFNRA